MVFLSIIILKNILKTGIRRGVTEWLQLLQTTIECNLVFKDSKKYSYHVYKSGILYII